VPTRIVLCSSFKGGSTKTTTTRCLASFAAAEGYRVATIDFDEQQTLTKWWRRRAALAGVPAITHYDIPNLAEAADALVEIGGSGDYDLVFVDTPPTLDRHSRTVKELVRAASFVLIPCRTGGEDLESVAEWFAMVEDLGKGGRAAFLLAATDRDNAMLDEAKAYLSDKGELCPHDVRFRTAIARSYFDGRGAADLPGKQGEAAALDYRLVWNFLRRKLELRG
jgi:chromosome partitioning protein